MLRLESYLFQGLFRVFYGLSEIVFVLHKWIVANVRGELVLGAACDYVTPFTYQAVFGQLLSFAHPVAFDLVSMLIKDKNIGDTKYN